ncbi:phytanoyl-CoA dioxygenase family protein [Hwanghaeella grinnelliae]|uniref:Phytanoyl-CoA dioxygenase family protein n=1 Tax=Hwanghaeella grinnelliae TaxID=2500179 RepID=A0A437QV75_9PROT|nr:phytanoyl-CoA dioxygenase family protein [Hwanghaeella grinnelliae]RVU38405.1 phytanoyl-CoA dioxygenase family protein [Hwanghaeella grinnelliae]
MLTEDQVASYRTEGYLVVPDIFTPGEIAELNTVTDTFVEASRALTQSDAVFDIGPGHAHADPKLRRIKDPTHHHAAYDKAMRHPKLIAILQQLLGDAVRFDHAKLNIKPVGGGAEIDWHQDWAFYPHTNDDMLAVGVLLDDVGPRSGPLQVVPGSHKGPTLNHHSNAIFCGAIDDAEAEPIAGTAVPLMGKAGSITIHHVRMVHGSEPNTSETARRLLLFSYAAVDAWPLLPKEGIDAFNERILTGAPTLSPRQVAVPVRIPLPKVETDGSIFDNQAHKQRSTAAMPA